MTQIDDYGLRMRRQKLEDQLQKCESRHGAIVSMGNMQASFQAVGEIAGRSVQRISTEKMDLSSSSYMHQIHSQSSTEEKVVKSYVNTLKKVEPYFAHDALDRLRKN